MNDDTSAGGRELSAGQHGFHTPAWVRKPMLLDEPVDEPAGRPAALLPTSQSLAGRRGMLPQQRPEHDDLSAEQEPEHVALPPEMVAAILAPRVPAGFVERAPEVESQPVRTSGRWLQQRGLMARLFGARGVRVTLEGSVLTVVSKGRHHTFDLSDPLQVGEYGTDTRDPDWTLELRPTDSTEPLVLHRDQVSPTAIVPVLQHHQAVAWARLEDRIGRYGR